MHLWTIDDVKDGDVLVNGSNIFIFHFFNGTRLMGYCHVNTDDRLFYDDLGKNECFCLIDAIVTPATREERELLFSKMKEVGYSWDAEKKELKNVEQKSDSYCKEHCKGFQETGKCFADWECKAKKEAEQKPAWSEEDEGLFVRVIQDIELLKTNLLKHDATNDDLLVIYCEEIDWLKSLKDRLNRLKGE